MTECPDTYIVWLQDAYAVCIQRAGVDLRVGREFQMGEFEQLVLMAVLRLKDTAYGVEIRRAVANHSGRDIAAGAVYTTLSRLEARGYVTSRVGETAPERTGQRRKYYRVEPEGAAALYRSYSALRSMASGLVTELEALAARAGESG